VQRHPRDVVRRGRREPALSPGRRVVRGRAGPPARGGDRQSSPGRGGGGEREWRRGPSARGARAAGRCGSAAGPAGGPDATPCRDAFRGGTRLLPGGRSAARVPLRGGAVPALAVGGAGGAAASTGGAG